MTRERSNWKHDRYTYLKGDAVTREKSATGQTEASIKVIGKAGLVLHTFLDKGPELHLQQISEATGLDFSTTSRIVSSLTAVGVLRFDSIQRLYSPGLMLLEMSRAVLSRFGFRELAHRELLALSTERGWVCFIGVPDDEHTGELIYIDVVSTRPNQRGSTEMGQRRRATATSSGLVLLAYGNIDSGPFLAAEPDLPGRLAKVRSQGYATVVDGDRAGAAVPLYGAEGEVIATLGAEFGAAEHESGLNAVLDALTTKAEGISSAIALSSVRELPPAMRELPRRL